MRTRPNNQTRGRERPQDSQALSFEYLERCRHILFRPTRKQPASGSLLTKLRRSSTFVSLCLLLSVTRLNNSHQPSRDPSLLDSWTCFGISNQEIKSALTRFEDRENFHRNNCQGFWFSWADHSERTRYRQGFSFSFCDPLF